MLQNLMRKMKKDNKGFTLVELMIVVVIIGILIAIAIPIYQNIQTNAERRACEANQRTIRSQMEVYRADASPATTYNFNTAEGAGSFDAFLADTAYFAEEPTCPTNGGTYTYTSTGGVVCADAVAGTAPSDHN